MALQTTVENGETTGVGEAGHAGDTIEGEGEDDGGDDDEEGGENELVVLDPSHVSDRLRYISDQI